MLNSYTCKECGAFFADKRNSAGHVCVKRAKDISEPDFSGISAAPVVSDSPAAVSEPEKANTGLKYTKDSLVAMNKKQLEEIAKEIGIDKIDGKYISACKVAEIEDAILAKQ